ncbi:MAG TPA: TIGR03435 family protein [Bryobacteraceae bacterium]|nr:TIGR03435 family protein [Bryobacteraceae bacterium]
MRNLGAALLIASLGVALAQDYARPPGGLEAPPDFPPSYQVHISPSGMTNPGASTTGGNYWVARGWQIRNMIAEAWNVEESRLDILAPADLTRRYDFAMVLPRPEERDTIYAYVRRAIEDQFHLRIGFELQSKDVYVLTAPGGMLPAVRILPRADNGSIASSLNLTDHSVSAREVSMAQFCSLLERLLNSLVIDETHIDGRMDIDVQGEGRGRAALIAMLRDHVGLVLTPGRRDVQMLVIRGE